MAPPPEQSCPPGFESINPFILQKRKPKFREVKKLVSDRPVQYEEQLGALFPAQCLTHPLPGVCSYREESRTLRGPPRRPKRELHRDRAKTLPQADPRSLKYTLG